MLLPSPEQIPRIVADGRRLAKRIGDPERSPEIALPASPGPAPAADRRVPWRPRLIHGEILETMAALLAGAPGAAAGRGCLDMVWLEAGPRAPGPGDASAGLTRLAAQLVLARRLLRRQGQLWIDIDWRFAHYARLLLEAFYGAGAFAAEIAWQPRPSVQRTVFAYRGPGRQRPQSGEPADDGYIRQRFPNIEAATGRRYWLDAATWRHDQAGLERMKADGQVVVSRAGVPYVKRYFTDGAETGAAPPGAQRLDLRGMPVESLLARIPGPACRQGALVAGFGTDPLAFAFAASALGLRWTSAGSDRNACVAAHAALHAQGVAALPLLEVVDAAGGR